MRRLLVVLYTGAALLAGCQSGREDLPWNRPSKVELSRNWIWLNNPEVDSHRQANPYP